MRNKGDLSGLTRQISWSTHGKEIIASAIDIETEGRDRVADLRRPESGHPTHRLHEKTPRAPRTIS